MKIEKINDNQIRCTLTREDLEKRHMKLSELAYGTDKAKSLFHEMMNQASYEYGFEAEDLPLMIEAVPVSTESIILVITKVENPDELDTRFSDFTEDTSEEVDDRRSAITADDILNIIDKAASDVLNKKMTAAEPAKEATVKDNITCLFAFDNLETIIDLSQHLHGFYDSANSLYKNERDTSYYLLVNQKGTAPKDFNKVCNIITEYGTPLISTNTSESYIDEHYTCILSKNALQTLSQI